jgi:MATE family multidrug resistance protein
MTAPRLSDHISGLARLGLPLVGSQLAQMAIGMTDAVMLGLYDVRVLAGHVLALVPFMVLLLFLSGFGFAVMPLVSAAAEAGDETRIRRVTRMGLWLSLGFGTLALPIFWFSAPLLTATGQEPALAATAQAYLRIMGFGLLPALGVMVLKSYLSALERARAQLLATIGAALVNIGLNWVFIFGHLGAPELGIRGAALASLSVNLVSFLALAIYARRSFPEHDLFRRLWRPDVEALAEVFAMGWNIGLTTLAEVGLFSFSSLLVGRIGTVALAAHGIALQLASLSFMVPLGLAQAATVRAGRAFGRRDRPALRMGARAAWLLGLGWALIAVIAFLALPRPLIGAFIGADDPLRGPILAMGATLLAVAALFQLFDATQVISVGLLRGLQDTRAPMIIAAASYWVVGAPAAWIFGLKLGLGAAGVWLGLVAGLGTAALLLTTRFLRASARLQEY